MIRLWSGVARAPPRPLNGSPLFSRSTLSRLRLTREEMAAEATRLATAFVKTLPESQSARCIGAHPDTFAPKSSSSKFSVVWTVGFVLHPPDVVVDGGELLVSVDIEKQSATIRE